LPKRRTNAHEEERSALTSGLETMSLEGQQSDVHATESSADAANQGEEQQPATLRERISAKMENMSKMLSDLHADLGQESKAVSEAMSDELKTMSDGLINKLTQLSEYAESQRDKYNKAQEEVIVEDKGTNDSARREEEMAAMEAIVDDST